VNVGPLARGSALGLVTLLVEKAASLVLVVALARLLSPTDYGRYSFVVAYLTLFQIVADFGIEPILLRRLAQEPAQRRRWMAGALGLRIAMAIASVALAVVLVPVAAPGQPDLRPIVAFGAVGLLFAAQPGYRALLRSEQRLGGVLGIAVAANVTLFVLVGIALASGGGLLEVMIAISAAHLAGFLLAAVVCRPLFRFRLEVDLPLWRSFLRESWPVGANLLVIMLGLRIAPLLLMSFRGPVEVGWLASATRLAEALNLFADGLMLALFPVLARLTAGDPAAVVGLVRVCAKVLCAGLLMVILLVSELAPEILGSLFGADFAPAAPALVVLSWFALLAGLGTLYAHLLVALGRQRVLFALNATSAIAQVGLQTLLVSRYGLMGAASGAVLASAANHAALYLLPATRFWIRPCVHALGGLVVLAGSLLVLAALVPAGAPLVRALFLPVLFLGVAVATRQIGPADLQELRDALRAVR